MEQQSLLCRWERKSKTVWLGKACGISGASKEKDWQKGKKRKEYFLLREHTNFVEQVLTVKKNMHLILNSSTGTLVAVAISTAPDGGFHRESMCSQAKPARIPHNMLREIKVQIARRHQGGTPTLHPCAWTSIESAWGSKRGQANQEWKVTSLLSLTRGFVSAMSLHTFLTLNLRSAVKSE